MISSRWVKIYFRMRQFLQIRVNVSREIDEGNTEVTESLIGLRYSVGFFTISSKTAQFLNMEW